MASMVCPRCWCVGSLSAEAPVCQWCSLDGRWLFRPDFDPLREVLEEWASVEQGVRIELKIAGQRPVVRTLRQARLVLEGPGEGSIELHWEPSDRRLQVRWGERELRLELPFGFEQFQQAWQRECGHEPPFGLRAALRVLPPEESPVSLRSFEEMDGDLLKLSRPGSSPVRLFGGSTSVVDVFLPGLSPRCAVAVFWDGQCWIATRKGSPLWVNGRPVVACSLAGGDLAQIGPYAFQFSQGECKLQPVGPLGGFGLEFRNVSTDFVRNISFRVEPGNMVAIVGPSGSGKTSLISTLLSQGEHTGQIFFWEASTPEEKQELKRENWPEFRRRVGYVPQGDVVHGALSPESITRFALQVRTDPDANRDVKVQQALVAVDLAGPQRHQPVEKLSGGERRRVVVASQIVTEPGVLILDEPTTGLDPEREEQILRQLRSLALRGATVLVITHGRTPGEYFDQVVELKGGRLYRVGPPGQLEEAISSESGQVQESTPAPAGDHSAARPLGKVIPRLQGANRFARNFVQSIAREALAWKDFRRQFHALWKREWQVLRATWLRRIGFPALITLLFAALLAMTVEYSSAYLLGFMMVLAVIWLSSSLTHLTIVDEGRIIEFERLSWLNVNAYFAVKLVVYTVLALVQTVLFWATTWAVRVLGAEMLAHPVLILPVLLLVSICGVTLGLAISAVALRLSKPGNPDPRIAGFILPLVMFAQIVFSVQVGAQMQSSGDSNYAYRDFSLLCSVNESDKQQDDQDSTKLPWEPDSKGWFWTLRVVGSYFTLSRYGDILVRHYGNKSQEPLNSCLWWESMVGLILFAPGTTVLLTWVLLAWRPSLRL